MTSELIQRYQSGGDIYQKIATKWGQGGADTVAAAALSGDETQINTALSNVMYGTPLETSTASIFLKEVTSNPLGGAIDGLNNQLKTLAKDILTNPFVLIGLGLVLFFTFGGGDYIRRKMKG